MRCTFSAKVPHDISHKDFLREVSGDAKCLARFIDNDLLFFTADLAKMQPEAVARFAVRQRQMFTVEERTSTCLIVRDKGGRQVGLETAVEIVRASPLAKYMKQIRAIAVPHRQLKVGCHIFVDMTSHEVAAKCVNLVDAMPHGGTFFHSPQLAKRGISEKGMEDHSVWRNEEQNSPSSDNPSTSSISTGEQTTSAGLSSSAGTQPTCVQLQTMPNMQAVPFMAVQQPQMYVRQVQQVQPQFQCFYGQSMPNFVQQQPMAIPFQQVTYVTQQQQQHQQYPVMQRVVQTSAPRILFLAGNGL